MSRRHRMKPTSPYDRCSRPPRTVGHARHFLMMRDREFREPLSPRESEIARLVADGRTTREIAELLRLSERTVDNTIWRAMQKQSVNRRADLAAIVRRSEEAGWPRGR